MESTSLEGTFDRSVRYQLDASGCAWSGYSLSQIACVTSVSVPLQDEVHTALRKAFVALGYADEDFCVCSTGGVGADRLLVCVEALDPIVAIALDRSAGRFLCEAYGVRTEPVSGELLEAGGRCLLVLDDFAASLSDEALKRAAWHQLKAADLRAMTR